VLGEVVERVEGIAKPDAEQFEGFHHQRPQLWRTVEVTNTAPRRKQSLETGVPVSVRALFALILNRAGVDLRQAHADFPVGIPHAAVFAGAEKVVAHFQAAELCLALAVDEKGGVEAKRVGLKVALFEGVVVEDLQPRAGRYPQVTVVANHIRQNGCGVLVKTEGAANEFSHSACFVLS